MLGHYWSGNGFSVSFLSLLPPHLSSFEGSETTIARWNSRVIERRWMAICLTTPFTGHRVLPCIQRQREIIRAKTTQLQNIWVREMGTEGSRKARVRKTGMMRNKHTTPPLSRPALCKAHSWHRVRRDKKQKQRWKRKSNCLGFFRTTDINCHVFRNLKN